MSLGQTNASLASLYIELLACCLVASHITISVHEGSDGTIEYFVLFTSQKLNNMFPQDKAQTDHITTGCSKKQS